MQVTQSHKFKGINQDDDTRFTQDGAYRFAQNVRTASTSNGKRSSIQQIKGTDNVLNYKVWNSNSEIYESGVQPVGDNICIGVCESREIDSIFYFIHNSNNDHTIVQYKINEEETIELLRSSTLNFNKDYLITGVAYNNDILYWTDKLNPIRQIDVINSKTLSTPITEGQLSFGKIAPTLPASLILTNTSKVDSDALKKHTYIVAYRYNYKDNSNSVMSPISLKVMSSVDNPLGEPLYAKNTINITVYYPTTNVSELIKSVEIMVKRSHTENFKVITKLKNGETSFAFTNNGFDYTLGETESSKFSEAIPLRSGSLVLAKDKIVLGNNVEDYEAVELNNSSVEGLYELENNGRRIVHDNQSFNAYGWGVMFFDDNRRNIGVSPIKNVFSNTSLPLPYVGKNREIYNLYYKVSLENDVPPSWATHYSIVRTANRKKSSYVQTHIPGGALGKEDGGTEFRPLGFFSAINPYLVGATQLKSKTLAPSQGSTLTGVVNQFIAVGDLVNWGASGNYTVETVTSTYFTVNREIDMPNVDNLLTVIGSGSSNISSKTTTLELDISTMAALGTGYNFSEGDRVWIPMLDLDSEVLSQNGNIVTVRWVYKGVTYNTNTLETKTLLVEFYTPTEVNDSDVYYETGYTFPIENGTFSKPIIDLKSNGGDRFHRGRLNFSKAKISFAPPYPDGQIADTHPNDSNQDFIVDNMGRISAAILDAKRINKETSLRFSNSFVANSNINGLSEFEALNEETLPIEVGPIEKLIMASNVQAEGSVMISVTQNEIVSVYLQESIYKDTSGTTTVAVTDKFIGSFNILQKGLGTYNPESVYQIDGRVYGFDAKKGVVWRYAQDGLSRISDKGMQSYFFNKSQPMYKDMVNSRAYGSFDYYNGEYILSLGKPSDSSMKTISYSENANAWTSFYEYSNAAGKTPEMFGSLNNNFYSVLNGIIYSHDTNDTRNMIYDDQKTSKVTIIGNVRPESNKIPQHIEEDADYPWANVKVETDRGQETNMTNNHFRTYENIHSVNVLRDINSKAIQSPKVPLIHGDRLRDKTFNITLESDNTSENNLYDVNVFYSESKR